jgi:hypothetical protein
MPRVAAKPAGVNGRIKHRKKQAPLLKPRNKITRKRERPDLCKWHWTEVQAIYVYGEKAPDAPATSMPTFPSLEMLAARFGIPKGSIFSYAGKHEWGRLRDEARPVILENVHQAMLRQAVESYIPARAGAVAVSLLALNNIDYALRGGKVAGLEGAVIADRSMVATDRVLKNIKSALGVREAPAVALQQNNMYISVPKPDAEAEPMPPPPSHAVVQTFAGSMWSILTQAREVGQGLTPVEISALEETSQLPAHLSSVKHG